MRLIPKLNTIGIIFLVLLAGLVAATIFYLRIPWITTETVSFQSDDVTLVGTLAVPRWRDGPYPAAVVVHGSGSSSRWLSWFHVRQLVPHGMAVLIYDKRGVGKSSGVNPQELIGTVINPQDIGNPSAPRVQINIEAAGRAFEILAEDALAGVEWLKNRSDIDRSNIGLVGGSQAGWIMPLAASHTNAVAFIVSISGPAVAVGIENRYSELTGEMPGYRNLHLSQEEMIQRLSEYDGPHGYDPMPVLSELQVPSLWLLGGLDESTPTSLTVANLEKLALDGAPVKLIVYPKGDHGLRRPDSEGRYEYWSERYDYWTDARTWLVAQDVLIQP